MMNFDRVFLVFFLLFGTYSVVFFVRVVKVLSELIFAIGLRLASKKNFRCIFSSGHKQFFRLLFVTVFNLLAIFSIKIFSGQFE